MKRRSSRKRNQHLIAIAAALGLSTLLGAFVLHVTNTPLSAVLPSVVTLLTNEAREEQKLSDLTLDPELSRAAQMKADDMAKRGYFSHTAPDGTQPWQWIDRTSYRYRYAGENLAINYDESQSVVDAWLASPKHRVNMLGAHYTDIGIGTATGTYMGRPAYFVVEFFASPAK